MPENYKVGDAKCLIMPSSKLKLMWDFYIVVLLLLVSIVVPFRLAFYEKDSPDWVIIYLVIDFQFLVDMILTFFTALTDSKTQEVIISKKQIAKIYLSGWFCIDFVSILPIDILSSGGADANVVLRFLKIGKLYKLIRLTRLAKLFKLLKSNNAVLAQMSNTMQLSSSVERIIFIAIFAIFFCHVSSCMFVFLCDFDSDEFSSWRYQDPYFS